MLPAPIEFPSAPFVPDDDCQAITGTGIREGLVVSCVWAEGDGNGGFGVKCMQPPAEFARHAAWLPTWHEWIATKNSQHQLQGSEVGTALWDD